MIPVHIVDESAPLEAVILGTARSMGKPPQPENAYDPKSKEHVLAGTYPAEEELVKEIEEVASVFQKYNVEVFRPELLKDYNQIFTRDIAFVIEDKLVVPCVTPERKNESKGIEYIIRQVKHVLLPGEHERMEGGDIMPWRGKLFVGYSKEEDFKKYKVARTNEAAVDYLAKSFPNWEVIAFELKKSDDEARENTLHLDCCFQPLGIDKAVIYPPGFKNTGDADFLIKLFGKENVFIITQEESYDMYSNFFSISPEVVISDKSFKRLNDQFREWGLMVEVVNYRETAKMEGLLRCSTMPLRRKYD